MKFKGGLKVVKGNFLFYLQIKNKHLKNVQTDVKPFYLSLIIFFTKKSQFLIFIIHYENNISYAIFEKI